MYSCFLDEYQQIFKDVDTKEVVKSKIEPLIIEYLKVPRKGQTGKNDKKRGCLDL